MGCQVVRATDEPEPAVPCDTCGAESVVVIETTDMASFEHSTRRLCEEHAPFCSPEEFFRRPGPNHPTTTRPDPFLPEQSGTPPPPVPKWRPCP